MTENTSTTSPQIAQTSAKASETNSMKSENSAKISVGQSSRSSNSKIYTDQFQPPPTKAENPYLQKQKPVQQKKFKL